VVISGDPEAGFLRAELLEIKSLLVHLQTEVRGRFEQNKELLSKRMTLLRADIKAMKGIPLGNRFSVYTNPGTPSFIDLEL
jgi:hypothetical protein